MDDKELAKVAIETREMAYMPYSGFAMGAALLTADGKLYQSCSIENVAYTPSNCVERTAFFKAVSIGEWNFTAIVVVDGKHKAPISEYYTPCGVRRQVTMEFYDLGTFRILLAKSLEEWQSYTPKELLPSGFSSRDLDR